MQNYTFMPEEYTDSSAKELNKICEAAMTAAYHENNLDVRDPSVVYTCTVRFIEALAKYLAKNPDVEIDVSSLLKFSVGNREDELGEKAGNIVPVVECGERIKLLIKNDDATEGSEED